ncbi:hypothetical protein BY458DRAFT_264993 [Sporodiniella umbellata]|nr:hypothetical protein BY458DRAFT_264993 [Sporodiniella umbellata]
MGLNNCCFCIPLRTGVTSIAVISFLFYLLCFISGVRNLTNYVSLEGQRYILGTLWTYVVISGLYTLSSSLGIAGGITQNRKMISVFRTLYWINAVFVLILSSYMWIGLLIIRKDIVSSCQDYFLSSTNNGFYSPVTLPSGKRLYEEECESYTKQALILLGIFVFLGNFIQIYFASTIQAYATRLKSVGTTQHHQLRNLEDFPETTKMAVY